MAFESLTEKLSSVFKKIRGQSRLTEDNMSEMLKEIRVALLEADVNFKVVKEFTNNIKEKAIGQKVLDKLNPGQMIVKIVHDELVELLGNTDSEIKYQNKVRFFIIDNLMEIENNSDNQFQEQTSIATKLRNIAIKYQLFIVLVMHTNKTSGMDGFRLTLKNAFGSSNITNKGYNIWFIYRKDQIETFNKNEKVLDRFKQDCAKCGFDFDKCKLILLSAVLYLIIHCLCDIFIPPFFIEI